MCPAAVRDATPGGIVARLSSLPTRTVTRSSSPQRARPVTSASNGVYPPAWSATWVSPAQTVP